MLLVSIIIPVYNSEHTLRKCLNSIVDQTYSNLEVILVDDGSVDKSNQICKEYCRKYSFFKLFEQENSGPAKARNYGVDQSSGEYIYFIDADDYLDPELIGSMVTAAEQYDAEMVICNYYTEKNGVSVPHEYLYDSGLCSDSVCRNISLSLINDVSEKRIPPYVWVRMICRSCLESPAIRFSESLHRSEDYHFSVRLHFRINRICIISEGPRYHYVDNYSSITHSYVNNYWESVRQIYFDLNKNFSDYQDVDERLKIMLIQRMLVSLNNSCRISCQKQFLREAKEILSDELIKDAVHFFPLKKGIENFGVLFFLLKFKLNSIVLLRYLIKHKTGK